MAAAGLVALIFLWSACAFRPPDRHVNLLDAIAVHQQQSHGRAAKSGLTDLLRDTATEQIAFRSDSALVQMRSDGRNKASSKSVLRDYITILFNIIDTDQGGTVSKKEWNKKVGRKSLNPLAAQPLWRDTMFKAMQPPAEEEPMPTEGRMAMARFKARQLKNKVTGGEPITMDEFNDKFQEGIHEAFFAMGGDDGKIVANELEDKKKWKGVSATEKAFAKNRFIDQDTEKEKKMTESTFTQFLYTVLLFRTMDIKDKGEALWADIEKDKKSVGFFRSVFGGEEKMKQYRESFGEEGKEKSQEKGFDVDQLFEFFQEGDMKGKVFD